MPDNGYIDLPVEGGGSGVTSLNSLTGALAITAGSGITVTPSGSNIAIAATGGGGTVTSVAMTVPSLLSISGSPITGAGTLALTYSGTALPILNGGTGQTTAANAINALLPSQTGNSGKVLGTNGTVASWVASGGGGGTPGGSNTDVQFNNSGSFGGSSNFTYVDGPPQHITLTSSAQGSIQFTNGGGTMGFGHDLGNNGSNNFYIYDYSTGQYPFLIDNTDVLNINNSAGTGVFSTTTQSGSVGLRLPVVTNSGMLYTDSSGNVYNSYPGLFYNPVAPAIGLGTQTPDSFLEVIGSDAGGLVAPTGFAAAFDLTGTGFTAAGDGTVRTENIYSVALYAGNNYYSPSASTATVTEAFVVTGGSTTQNDGSGSYTADGTNNFEYNVYALYSGKASGPLAIYFGPDNNDGQPFSVQVYWTAPGQGTPDSYIVENYTTGTGTTAPGSNTNVIDDGGWGTVASPPSMTYNINCSWSAAAGATNYELVGNNGNAAFTGNVTTYEDNNAFALTPVTTPNTVGQNAGHFTGPVTIDASGYLHTEPIALTVIGQGDGTNNKVLSLVNGSTLTETFYIDQAGNAVGQSLNLSATFSCNSDGTVGGNLAVGGVITCNNTITAGAGLYSNGIINGGNVLTVTGNTSTTSFANIYSVQPYATSNGSAVAFSLLVSAQDSYGLKYGVFSVFVAGHIAAGALVIDNQTILNSFKTDATWAFQVTNSGTNLLLQGHGNTISADNVAWAVTAIGNGI